MILRARHDETVAGAPGPGELAPIGVLLAGGAGTRMGGAKLTAQLGGRPLFSYPLAALTSALQEVAVIGKPGLALADLGPVKIWIEPPAPRHPLVGIVHALQLARGRAVLVCPADLPFITPALIRSLALARTADAPAVIATRAGALQPLLGCYEPAAARLLADAAAGGELPARAAVAAIGPRLLEVELEGPDELFNVNSPGDLRRAAALLLARGRPDQPNVKS
ncbi:MAG: molybdenum cofactor guanylyltransferase [Solirubrobacteraceae bacterium]